MLRDSQAWHGGKILVAEDSELLAEVICDFLRECGLEPVGPAGQLDEASRIARSRALDGALLDLKLGTQFCFPVCSILAARRVPFIFLTGLGELSVIPMEFRAAPLISKPFDTEEMKAALASILRRGEGSLFAGPRSELRH